MKILTIRASSIAELESEHTLSVIKMKNLTLIPDDIMGCLKIL
jgi:hypothetical protein